MATEAKLRQLADKGCPVYYFYSSERYLVRQAVAAVVRVLSADSDEDATILDGAAPELEQLIMAAGSISGSTTTRRVPKNEMVPAAMMSCSSSGAPPSRMVASSSLSADSTRTAAATACRTRYCSLE